MGAVEQFQVYCQTCGFVLSGGNRVEDSIAAVGVATDHLQAETVSDGMHNVGHVVEIKRLVVWRW